VRKPGIEVDVPSYPSQSVVVDSGFQNYIVSVTFWDMILCGALYGLKLLGFCTWQVERNVCNAWVRF